MTNTMETEDFHHVPHVQHVSCHVVDICGYLKEALLLFWSLSGLVRPLDSSLFLSSWVPQLFISLGKKQKLF